MLCSFERFLEWVSELFIRLSNYNLLGIVGLVFFNMSLI